MAKKPNKTRIGRPPVPTAEHVRRGTVQPCRTPKRQKHASAGTVLRGASRDYPAIAESYVRDVLEGRIVACRWTKLACARFRTMRERGVNAYAFSPEHVTRVCAFIERLPHVEGRWSSETLTLAPWQVFMLAAIYGFRRPDGGRLVTTVFFQVARKS